MTEDIGVPEDLGVYVCRHIFRHERSVRLIAHHWNGMRQATCGEYDHPKDRAELFLIHARHFAEPSGTVGKLLLELPAGYLAEEVGGKWQLSVHDD